MDCTLYVASPVHDGEQVPLASGTLDDLLPEVQRVLTADIVDEVVVRKGKPGAPTDREQRGIEVVKALAAWRESASGARQ